jgi:hypothetical protein
MRLRILAALALTLLFSLPANAARPAYAPTKELPGFPTENASLRPVWLADGKRFVALARIDSSVRGGRSLGLTVGFGYHFADSLGVDWRFSSASAAYGAIHPLATAVDLTSGFESANDPSSELNRARESGDPWNYLLTGPGIYSTARLMPFLLPPWIAERGRFGLSRGAFTDKRYGANFTGLVASFEASALVRVSSKSPFQLDASLAWHVGAVTSTDTERAQSGRLPVSWLQASLGLALAF